MRMLSLTLTFVEIMGKCYDGRSAKTCSNNPHVYTKIREENRQMKMSEMMLSLGW